MAAVIAIMIAMMLIQAFWVWIVVDLNNRVAEQGRAIETLMQAESDRQQRDMHRQTAAVVLTATAGIEVQAECQPEFEPLDVPLPDDFQLLVWELCGDYETFLSQQEFFELILRLMWSESSHRVNPPDNSNGNGSTDRGPMQINSINWGWLYDDHGLDINCPADNIEAGILILAGHLNRYQCVEHALTAYVNGSTGAARMGGQSARARWTMSHNLGGGEIS